MDANNMDIKLGTGTRHINILSSEDESSGDASTTNIIIPYVNGGSVSSHNLHPELSPSNRKREEERKEEEYPRKSLHDDTNDAATIPMCNHPGAISTFIMLP